MKFADSTTDCVLMRDYNDKKLITHINTMNCAICLNGMRKTRHTRELKCGHCFHSTCFSKWEQSGGETCPLCREEFNKPLYKITINIKNTNRNTEQTLENIDPVQISNLISIFDTDIQMDMRTTDELESFFRDIGFSLTDIDPSVLDTE